MQDINQQLYENKSTPEGFIPVYGVVITVPTGNTNVLFDIGENFVSESFWIFEVDAAG